MNFITSERLKNEINENVGEELIVSKYELVMLIAKRAKQIAEKMAEEEYVETEEIKMRKPISEAIGELEADELIIEKSDEEN